MDTMVMKGNTVEEATEAALKVLGVKREDVEVKVLKEGKTGVLGVFGVEAAEVEVSIKGSSKDFALSFLQGILDRTGFMALVSVSKGENEDVSLSIRGEDMGRIIGKEGATLDALQSIVGVAASRKAGRKVRVTVDAEGYRDKQKQSVEKLAREKAEEVKRTGKEVMLPPLTGRERLFVHLVLEKDPDVKTYSEGERDQRRLIIAPKGKE
ncbi:MAG: KH domain-containing protein [Candidatus Saganbacteria bacterium]|nr:KH domain-containing protein [Candidatus Saganbacteria bacterium]